MFQNLGFFEIVTNLNATHFVNYYMNSVFVPADECLRLRARDKNVDEYKHLKDKSNPCNRPG